MEHYSPLATPEQQKHRRLFWRLFALLALAGMVAATLLVIHSADEEKRQTLANMQGRADVLIWALEGSSRSLRHMRQSPMRALIEEVAKQPGVAYIAVVDGFGRVLMHSQPELVGQFLYNAQELLQYAHEEHSQSRFSPEFPDIFETVKRFTPYSICGSTGHGGRHSRHRPYWDSSCGPDCTTPLTPPPPAGLHPDGLPPLPGDGPAPAGTGLSSPAPAASSPAPADSQLQTTAQAQAPPQSPPQSPRQTSDLARVQYIIVGLDASHFRTHLHEYTLHLGLITGLLTLAALAGLALVFYIRNYRSSRRMLEDTQALAHEVISNLPSGLVVTDPQGRIILSNAKGRNMLGLDGQDAPRLQDAPVLNWQALMAELDSQAKILERDVDLFRSKANPLPVSLSAARVVGSEHNALGYVFILGDLGEIRRLQKQLRQSERLSALGNLAAGVAHEIRNPLSSIKGYATYLTEKLKDDKMAYATGNILIQETERLNRVMSDLLGVARPLELHPLPKRIDQVLQQALRVCAMDAEEKQVALQLHLPPAAELPKAVALLDSDRLIQALLNLLVNAVQATPPKGRVDVTLTQAGERWSISISDTGCGMSAETVRQLFTPYFTTKAQGTGLGLVLSQQIIERHGGEIKVFSQPDKGSVFTVLLPACPSATPAATPDAD